LGHFPTQAWHIEVPLFQKNPVLQSQIPEKVVFPVELAMLEHSAQATAVLSKY
jgi:hypothetical protein